MSTAHATAQDWALTATFLADLLRLQTEIEGGLEYLTGHSHTETPLHLELVARGIASTINLRDWTAILIRNDGALLFAWQGTLALVQREGGAA